MMGKETNMKTRNDLLAMAAVTVAVALSGCSQQPGKVTGGGWIPSSSGVADDKANFGFNADSCDGSVHGHFNYHDKEATAFQPGGVKMNGPVIESGLCSAIPDPNSPPCVCAEGEYEVEVAYRSTNPRFPGTGTAIACVKDNGEGLGTTDTAGVLAVTTGPYTGYSNSGPVQGNIQAHSCPGQ